MNRLILATNNAGKITELQAILAPIICIAQGEVQPTSIEETGLSFVENALIKARNACKITGEPALADDSGLVVPMLNGQPGIHSARFAGMNATDAENRALLLNKLKQYQGDARQAFFYCAIVILQHENDPTPIISTGRLNGIIHPQEVGTHGFGYDAIFYLPEYKCTLAELPLEIKNNLSHRAQALKEVKHKIQFVC